MLLISSLYYIAFKLVYVTLARTKKERENKNKNFSRKHMLHSKKKEEKEEE